MVGLLLPRLSRGFLLSGFLPAPRFVALLLLLAGEFAPLLLGVVLLRTLLLLRFVLLRTLLLSRLVLARALLLFRVVLPRPLLGALLFALRLGVASVVPLPIAVTPVVVAAIAVVAMIVVVVVLVDRDVDVPRRRVATGIDVAARAVGVPMTSVVPAAAVVPGRRPGRHEAPGKGDRQCGKQDRR